MAAAIEASTMRKVYMRLLPFAMLSYVLAYIDRINVSFAALTMRDDLHMSAGDFGFAGGIFAGATAFVTSATSFGVVRFLLGMAEAGFFPGLILYFTYWFPARHHARIVSGFLVGLPIAVAFGAPISTGLMSLDGLFGLRGWQIMYLAEAIPTVIIGIATYFILTDKPHQAKFLTQQERDWLVAKIASENKAKEAVRIYSLFESMINPKVLLLALNYIGIVTASLGML